MYGSVLHFTGGGGWNLCLLDIDISMTSDFVSLVCVLRP